MLSPEYPGWADPLKEGRVGWLISFARPSAPNGEVYPAAKINNIGSGSNKFCLAVPGGRAHLLACAGLGG
jgi:hypothetical protein